MGEKAQRQSVEVDRVVQESAEAAVHEVPEVPEGQESGVREWGGAVVPEPGETGEGRGRR